MQPVFRQPGEGGVTAANASQMSDGAAAVLPSAVAPPPAGARLGIRAALHRARVAVGADPVTGKLTWRCRKVRGPAATLGGGSPTATEPAPACRSMRDMDWIGVANEAFASVATMASCASSRPAWIATRAWSRGGGIPRTTTQ